MQSIPQKWTSKGRGCAPTCTREDAAKGLRFPTKQNKYSLLKCLLNNCLSRYASEWDPREPGHTKVKLPFSHFSLSRYFPIFCLVIFPLFSPHFSFFLTLFLNMQELGSEDVTFTKCNKIFLIAKYFWIATYLNFTKYILLTKLFYKVHIYYIS